MLNFSAKPRSFSRLVVASSLLIGVLFSSESIAESVQIGALVSGQVSKVYVSEGQMVKKGDALLDLDSARYQAKANSLSAAQKLQKLKLADAKVELAQAQDLFDRTVTAKRSLDAAQLAYDLALAAYEKAKAEVAMHQAWSKYVFIKSPIDAKVAKIQAPMGATVFQENNPLILLEK